MQKLLVYGVVQGVGFRPAVYRVAKAMGLRGWVKNNGSNVEIVVDDRAAEFVEELKRNLPPNARISEIKIEEVEGKLPDSFVILSSTDGKKDFPPPPDYGMCNACLGDFSEKGNRRYNYAFTNCTDCGARFAVIKALPFDRANTTMDEFQMCEACRNEYSSPENRRFHAQTISCPKCGPRYLLYNRNADVVDAENPFKKFAEQIDAGSICVLKTYGGMHLICSLEHIPYFREWYRRKTKPFALMLRNLETVEKYALLSEKERELLCSQSRPIVLVRKKGFDEKIENAAPKLPNFGVMLPYAPVHYLVFQHLKSDGFVATSANPPGEPMHIENQAAFSLGADYYLLHNMEIYNRCDDAVLRVYRDRKFFIRKSRGFVPDAIVFDSEKTCIGVGAQENLSASLLFNGKIYTTQYIGDGENYAVIQYLKQAIKHYLHLFEVKEVDTVCIDLHPGYTTRKVGVAVATEFNANLVEVQHHWAHAGSLLVDNGEERCVCLALDGTGYGPDGGVWGGEVLVADYRNFRRFGHLSEFPLIGGEKAVYDIGRIAFGLAELAGFELKREDAEILRKLMGKSVRCTSMGRFLDGLSYILGVCRERTYDGEPAMQLETLLMSGRTGVKMPENLVEESGKEYVVNVVPVVARIFECLGKERNEDIAYSAVEAVARALVGIAARAAGEYGCRKIGVTGGVSYNEVIVGMLEKHAKDHQLELMLHDSVPNGDMGISVGQCAIGGKLEKVG
ncbi:MAG: carbamoyltransferase HypF [Thermoplasmata archaeon]|nr:carbamoyltransferase HypF [Thermoplasmata archaeon]